jgi:hypothetical protein
VLVASALFNEFASGSIRVQHQKSQDILLGLWGTTAVKRNRNDAAHPANETRLQGARRVGLRQRLKIISAGGYRIKRP